MYIHAMVRHTAVTPEAARFYGPAGYCAGERVGWLMKRALMSIAQAADRRLEPKGITHAQWAALFMLQRCRASTVAELARETQSDPGAMTRLLDRLEAKGFCRRQRSTDDRRVVRIELTPEGELAAQEVPVVMALAGCASPRGITSDAALIAPTTLGVDPTTTTAPVAAEWWRGFEDPVLDDLIARATAGTPSLRVAAARAARASANVASANAAEGPQVTGSIDATRQRFTATGLYPPPIAGSIRDTATA